MKEKIAESIYGFSKVIYDIVWYVTSFWVILFLPYWLKFLDIKEVKELYERRR